MSPFLQRVLVAALIIFGIWMATFFGLQTFHAFNEVREHRPPPPPLLKKEGQPESDVELIKDWMTVPFVGKMYHVPPPVICDALGIPLDGNREKSLKQLNDKYFPDTPNYVLELVKTTVQANLPSTAVPASTVVPGVSP